MAKNVLIGKAVLTAGCALVLSSCTPVFGDRLTKDPREVGQTVEQIHKEVLAGLIVRPSASTKIYSAYCGEDWEERRKVTAQKGDPWNVNYNRFKFLVGSIIPIESGHDAPPVYRTLINNLRQASGWKIQENYSTNGFLGGVGGEKSDVLLSISHRPDGKGKTEIYVSLQSKCYKHPNA